MIEVEVGSVFGWLTGIGESIRITPGVLRIALGIFFFFCIFIH